MDMHSRCKILQLFLMLNPQVDLVRIVSDKRHSMKIDYLLSNR